MKKHILLTTTAMLLSAITLNANAEPSNTATLDIYTMFVKPMELIQDQYLGFGIILADEGGKKVVVEPDGSLGEETDATMMYTKKHTNFIDANLTQMNSLNEGIIRAKGFLNDIWGNFGITDFNNFLSINLDQTVILRDIGDEPCGTVTALTPNITADEENGDLLIHIGGTLTTEKLSGIARSYLCGGSTTVTVVINDKFAEN